MDREKQEQEKRRAKERELHEKSEKARAELDEIPPPGTDPLHEGP
jgi:hypothetical protein